MIAQEAAASALGSAKKVCAGIHSAYRSIRLYPQEHPSVRAAIDLLAATLDAHLEAHGPLSLEVEEERLVCEGEPVYTGEVGKDNLAFLMFRDGVRFLAFQPGIEPRETEALLDCLARADQLADTDQDFSTALWEHDLAHIEYEVVDPFLEGEGAHGDAFEDLRETVTRRIRELSSGPAPGAGDQAAQDAPSAPGSAEGGPGGEEGDAGDGDGRGDGGGDGGDETEQAGGPAAEDVALTEAELQRRDQLLADLTGPFDDFVIVLLEIAGESATSESEDDAVVSALATVVERFLDRADLEGLDLVMTRLTSLEGQGRRPVGFARELFCRAASAERLTNLIAGMAAAPPERAARIEQFLGRVYKSVYPALLEALAASNDKGVRKAVLGLLNSRDGVPVEHLWPLMRDPRWYVVRNAVQLATGSGDPELIQHLERLLRHGDARVRREVVRSLDSLADPRSLSLLAKALQDEDSSVRILAVRSVSRRGSRGQSPAVEAHVRSRDFDTRTPEELEAFLTAFAVLGGEHAVATLNRVWKRRMFGTRPMAVRLAAVQALGAVGSPEAKKALGEAARSSETQLQRAATRALTESGVPAKGRRS